ncbi:MAG TPA: site-2 protease family protein [Dehalococcoidia bacterium]|nr:site-2 protease family protein [Dehalococcoidia bacterium]
MQNQHTASPPLSPSPRGRPSPASRGAFRIGRLFGVEILAHWSWPIVIALLTWSLQAGFLPAAYPQWTVQQRWAVGLLTSLLLFGSVLLHELAHALVARRRGYRAERIVLYLFGGGTELTDEPRRPRDEFWIAAAGPLTSIAAIVAFSALWLCGRVLDLQPLYPLAGYLALMNALLAAFNLLPGLPLDGGRMLRALLWSGRRSRLQATHTASIGGRIIAALLFGVGILRVLGGDVGGLWFALIGWFLWEAAQSSYRRLLVESALGALPVSALTDRDVPRLPPDLPLRRFVDEYVLGRQVQAAFVAPTDDADVLGLITLTDLRRVPPDQWDEVSVYRAMTPRDRLIATTPESEALAALETMAAHQVRQLPVFQGRTALGLVTLTALAQAIQLRRTLPVGQQLG